MFRKPANDAPSLLLDQLHVVVRSVPLFMASNGKTGTQHDGQKTHVF